MNSSKPFNYRREFESITIHVSSPETILTRSHGEVLKPETINYRSYKPEKDGLFCEKIFGPVKDWECHCGKYKRIRYKGIICDRCGVEVARKKVRRERMGHITLAVPVVHIWFLRSIPSKLYYLLNIKTRNLEEIVYYEKYVVINQGESDLPYGSVISEEEYFENMIKYGPKSELFDEEEAQNYFIAKTGGEAIRELLHKLDIEVLVRQLKNDLKSKKSATQKAEILKRLKVVRAFLPREGKPVNKPEWMVITVLPVIPPDLRPLVPLEGGRFAASDLNDLYRRVIIRNNRLKQLIEIKAPDVILRNEKRMLQEAVDSLFDNSRRRTEVRSGTRRPLKSLSDMLKGKEGRFRQNLLGKRVDYSGRSVIVAGPNLKLNECGLPKEMAIELFKPHLIHQLIRRNISKTPKAAKAMVDQKNPEVYRILEYVVKDHPVLLNRAPTLHRLGIQAFQPVLIDGKAIQIHPLVCAAFNADFDGDQMAVHIPLSFEAQMECRVLIMSSHNILHPAHGFPVAIPSQDMVLGVYYITRQRRGAKGEGNSFSSTNEALTAYWSGELDIHAIVKIRVNGKIYDTTVGRALFNSLLPKKIGYINELISKNRLETIVREGYNKAGNYETVKFLDKLKDIGFKYATRSGISISMSDILIPEKKSKLIEESFKRVEDIQRKFRKGILTEGERYNKIIDNWTHTTNEVADVTIENLSNDKQGFNPVFMMADSGARGSSEQIKQLAGMRGLMAKPQKSMTGQVGEIIETPITSNFKEGLSVLEYFISTHGARKGLADTALKTADAGYLTRRLVDVAQDVVITEEDCGTINGIEITALKKEENIIENLSDRIVGRVAQEDVYNPEDEEEIIVEAGQEINRSIAHRIQSCGIEKVRIRSVLTCESLRGVCAKCYGRNLASDKMVNIGESVGIMAAQSIGEPGTQLTLRTFHYGGTAARVVEESEVEAKSKGRVVFSNNYKSIINKKEKYSVALSRDALLSLIDENNRVTSTYNVPYGSHVVVKENEQVNIGQTLFLWDVYMDHILALRSGKVRFVDLIENVTYSEETDESGHKSRIVIESKDRTIQPRIDIIYKVNGEEKISAGFMLPVRSMLVVDDGESVVAGDVLAKIPKEIGKTSDITGGLPRVAELFEARRPKDPAIISEIDGQVKFGKTEKGIREIIVVGPDGQEKRYKIPYGRYVLVNQDDEVQAGERLCEGPVAPQDILAVQDPRKVQEYLVNGIQEVYRLQGVRINDKHIEVIVRQMMQKVSIEDPGDTNLLEKDRVNRNELIVENERIKNYVVIKNVGDSDWDEGDVVSKKEFAKFNRLLKEEGKNPAKARQAHPAKFNELLLGITRASLNTESFISAASFQETTRILTDAAVAGKTDYLRGLKENVIMGRLIPAGTGLRKYKDIVVIEPEEEIKEWELIREKKKSEEAELAALQK
ncbi:MAG: DNA-directed RNA polymerase subunit beta' [Candidatus Neomarinimicrobiota bacterium]|nr:MAG: DNA-directed RNA polymerase subunit beta' [Candidatus Neomarinimicrobiota bacterium]